MANARDRPGDVGETAPCLEREPLLNQHERARIGAAAAQAVQAGLAQAELPCIACDRPMTQILRLDQQAKAPQPLQIRIVRHGRRNRSRLHVRHEPKHAAGEPGRNRRDQAVGLAELFEQPPQQELDAQGETWMFAERDESGRREQGLDGRTLRRGSGRKQAREVHGQHVPLRVGVEVKAMDGIGRNHDRSRPVDRDAGSLELRARSAARHEYALALAGVAVGADFPKVLAASRGDVLDVQVVDLQTRVGASAVERKARDRPWNRPGMLHGSRRRMRSSAKCR